MHFGMWKDCPNGQRDLFPKHKRQKPESDITATISAFSEHLTPRPLGPLSGRNDSSCVSLHGLRVANPHKPFGNQAPHTFGCHFEVALLHW